MKLLKWLASAALIALSMNTFAALHLELTKGMSRAIPIAVIPFSGQAIDTKSPDNVAQVIHSDLQNSGMFKVMEVNKLPQMPHLAANINYQIWKNAGVDDLVIGRIKKLGGNKYSVDFNLVSVYKGIGKKNATENPLLVTKHYVVNKSQLRSLAHQISNIVYQQLTGIRGIFNTKIAYVLVKHPQGKAKKFYLYVADYDGYNARPILISNQPIMSPSWAPNAKEIAYVSFEHQRAAIYVSNVITGKRHLITDYAGINGAPAFSPNGKQLALVLSKTGYAKIYLMNLQSKQMRQITHGWSIDTEPRWAADGKSFIFSSTRGGGLQLYRYTLATGKITRLTYGGNYNATGSFTPNDQQIVFLHRQDDRFNIASQNLDTGYMTELTRTGGDSSPTLAPNGQMILYVHNKGFHGDLAMVSIDGQIHITIPSPDGSIQSPAWSPYIG